MNDPAARQHLLTFNREHIEMTFVQGSMDGVVNPVVYVLDLNDPRAKLLAEATQNPERVATSIREPMTPTAFVAIPFSTAILEMKARLSPTAFEAVTTSHIYAHGMFYVVCIGFGGTTVMAMTVPKF